VRGSEALAPGGIERDHRRRVPREGIPDIGRERSPGTEAQDIAGGPGSGEQEETSEESAQPSSFGKRGGREQKRGGGPKQAGQRAERARGEAVS